jgi:hypothetical protein
MALPARGDVSRFGGRILAGNSDLGGARIAVSFARGAGLGGVGWNCGGMDGGYAEDVPATGSIHDVAGKLIAMPLRGRANLQEQLNFREKIVAILKSDRLINGIVLAAIVVGFFHGWLKVTFPNPATTFLFDALLGLALALVYLKKRDRGNPFFLKTRVGKALTAFYFICFLYLFVPGGPPLIVAVAAMRGWCFASLMYCLGYHLTESITQIKGYFYVLVLLGVITALYGIRQTPEEVRRKAVQDAHFAERYKGIYYATSSGKLELRRFSTFVSSGVFGSVMAFVSIFAIVLFTDPTENKTERILLMGAIVPLAYALVLSGARAALIMLAAGFLTIAWYRRKFQTFILLPAILLVALNYGIERTSGNASERYETLLQKDTVVMRMLIPTVIGWRSLQENAIGYGLGKSGYSVPFFLSGRTGYNDYRAADGDLGCLMIEMGVIGLILFGRVLWAALRTVYEILVQLRETPVATVALASAASMIIAVMIFPIGSPFLGIPTGALTWFFLGTLQKLAASEVLGAKIETKPPLAIDQQTKRFLYYRPKARA